MRYIQTLLFACLLTLTMGRAEASPLTLEQAIARAIAHHPSLAIAQQQIVISESQRSTADRFFTENPTLKLEGQALSDPSLSVGLAQSFEIAGQSQTRRAIAEAYLLNAKAERDSSRRQLLLEVISTYDELIYWQGRFLLSEAEISRLEKLQAIAQERLKAGDISRVEAITAEASWRSAENHRDLIEMERQTQWIRLRQLMGEDLQQETTPSLIVSEAGGSPIDWSKPPSVEGRPEWQALVSRERSLMAQRQLLEQERIPSPEIGLFYEHPMSTAHSPSIKAELDWPLPIIDLKKSDVVRLQVQLQQLQEEKRLLQSKVIGDWSVNRVRYERLQGNLKRWHDLRSTLEGNYGWLQTAYQAGEVELARVLAAQSHVMEARLALLEIGRDLQAASRSLRLSQIEQKGEKP